MDAKENCTLVVLNGNIWTGDQENPRAEALGIIGDTIVHVGTNEDVQRFINESTKVIDVKGKFVVPGFIDSHVHFLMGGERLNSVTLTNVNTKDEFVQTIGEYVKKIAKGQWITGGSWDHANWGGEIPDRFWIDDVTKENPVLIGHYGGHMSLANTLALTLSGLLDKHIKDVEGGVVVRNDNGVPTGILKDNAIGLVVTKMCQPTKQEYSAFLQASSDYALKSGVTYVHHMGLRDEWNRGGKCCDLDVFLDNDNEGQLRTRIYCAEPLENWKQLANRMKNGSKSKDKMLRYGSLKCILDGGVGSRTAAFFEPYADSPCNNGIMLYSPEDVYQMVVEADKHDLQIFIHGIGDRTIHTILDIFERVEKENGPKDRRWRIEHAQHIRSDDIPRFKKLGVIASMQPYHAVQDGRITENVLGKNRLKGTYAFRSLIDAGVDVCFGSDWFVAPMEPLKTIDAAVNRLVDGTEPFTPEERITVEETLYACTLWAARSVHEENLKGSLKVGKLADFVVLDQNLLTIDPMEIKSTKILKTVLGGKVLYEFDG